MERIKWRFHQRPLICCVGCPFHICLPLLMYLSLGCAGQERGPGGRKESPGTCTASTTPTSNQATARLGVSVKPQLTTDARSEEGPRSLGPKSPPPPPPGFIKVGPEAGVLEGLFTVSLFVFRPLNVRPSRARYGKLDLRLLIAWSFFCAADCYVFCSALICFCDARSPRDLPMMLRKRETRAWNRWRQRRPNQGELTAGNQGRGTGVALARLAD
ncbi:hypothetical protein GGTG_04917 [Gaeumannomyces tritici R3-111a-1]|uniref:Uncharacterized protein n=1 Tax=Gaeumannomyces tritici (strain R3-111a-1) TaxID=644352 RepID=J3NUG1_GAET3|nr:hypothetical protein GGTG_04917 [Gaeumannomyces tritici R3-111a-1]EJT79834.1 hypothetical protein GGTG_04917 [Gaeumannomyces tritici R3-111a-1]